jgi:predicted glycosyltransferase
MLWTRAIRQFQRRDHARIFLVPRDREQLDWLRESFGSSDRIHVFPGVTDGPALVAAADLVISGGGTMNREAAALGVPAWSVFTGRTPYVDECLAREGRLRWVRTSAEYEDAWNVPPPSLLTRRGPFPAGLDRIANEVLLAARSRGFSRWAMEEVHS